MMCFLKNLGRILSPFVFMHAYAVSILLLHKFTASISKKKMAMVSFVSIWKRQCAYIAKIIGYVTNIKNWRNVEKHKFNNNLNH